MRFHTLSTAGLIIGALVAAQPGAFAQPPVPITVTADADTYVRIDWDGNSNSNNGCEWVGTIGNGRFGATKPAGAPDALRMLVHFDLSALPAGASIQSAVLKLTLAGSYSPAGAVFTVDVHRIIDSPPLNPLSPYRSPWVEGRGTQSVPPPAGSGCTGVDPADGVAWLGVGDNPFRSEAANNVTQPDFDPVKVASATIVNGVDQPGQVVSFDLTPLVRQWAAGTVPNFGIVLRDLTDVRGDVPPPPDLHRELYFASREARPYFLQNLDGPQLVVTLDSTPPVVTCDSPDGQWHNANVALACTAADAGSGLADPADASFTLVTTVAPGDENANAYTSQRVVCDKAGNCATADAIGGNKVDRKAPFVSITVPSSSTLTIGQVVAADYGCLDGGSGIASCLGAVANGQPINTSSVGSFPFTVTGTDQAGNTASASASFTVAYDVCVLFDPWWAVPPGSIFPVAIRLCNVKGQNMSAAAVGVTVLGIVPAADVAGVSNASLVAAAHSDAFCYVPLLRSYVFNVKTKGLSRGTYMLQFKAGLDPTVHVVSFRVH